MEIEKSTYDPVCSHRKYSTLTLNDKVKEDDSKILHTEIASCLLNTHH